MLTNGTITLFQQETAGGEFSRRGAFPAWIRRKERLRSTNRNTYISDNFDVRLEHSKVSRVSPGDLIYFGDLAEEDFKPHLCRRISAVSENTFGTIPHWHIEAEIQYR